MTHIYDRIENADIIVVATPIYFGSLSAQLKILIDRCQPLWVRKELFKEKFKPKKGVFFAVSAGDKEKDFENALYIIRNFFAAIGVSERFDMYIPGVEKEGQVQDLVYVEDNIRNIAEKLF